MIKYSHNQQVVSVLIIFILLIQISGCVSSRIISAAELPFSGKYFYRIHGQKSNYLLENTTISNGILSGKVNPEKSSRTGKVINVYLSSDSVMKFDSGHILSIPVVSIVKVEKTDFSPGKTILLLGAVFIAITAIFLGGTMGGIGPLL